MHDGRVRVMTYDLQAVCICTLLFFIKLNVGRVLHNTKSIELNVSQTLVCLRGDSSRNSVYCPQIPLPSPVLRVKMCPIQIQH